MLLFLAARFISAWAPPALAEEPLTFNQAGVLFDDASMAALEALRPSAVLLLDEVSRATPNHVRVTKLRMSGPVLRIEALGGDPADREAFAAALCADGRIVRCRLEARPHIDPFTIHALVTVPRAASATRGGIDVSRVLGSPATELSRAAALSLAHQASDEQGATGLTFDGRGARTVGAVDLFPVQVGGYCGFHDLGVLMDRVQRSPEPSYWSSLELTLSPAPAGLAERGLARAQSASRLGWPLDAVAVAVTGELLWPTPARDPGPALVDPGVAWPSGPALSPDWSYTPAGLRDPFRDQQLWRPEQPQLPPPTPMESGAFVVEGVRAEAALNLAARAAGLVVRWEASAETGKDARVSAAGSYGSLRELCAAALKSTGLAAVPTKTELRVRRISKPAAPPDPPAKSGGNGTTSLDSVPLDALWLVGLANGPHPLALLVDAHDDPFVVRVGSHLLDHRGEVSAILSDRIVVSFPGSNRSPVEIGLFAER